MYDLVGVCGLGSGVVAAANIGGAALSAAGDIAVMAACQPFRVKQVGIIITTTCTVTPPVVDIYRRPVAGSDTNRVLIKKMTFPAIGSCVAGNVIYADGLNTLIKPGEDLIAEVSTAATAGAGHVSWMLEPQSESPMNYTNCIKV